METSAPEAPLDGRENQHPGGDGQVEPGEPGDGLLDEEEAVAGGLQQPVRADQEGQQRGVGEGAAGEAHRGVRGGAHAAEAAPSGGASRAPLRARWRERTRQATKNQVAVSTTFMAAKP